MTYILTYARSFVDGAQKVGQLTLAIPLWVGAMTGNEYQQKLESKQAHYAMHWLRSGGLAGG